MQNSRNDALEALLENIEDVPETVQAIRKLFKKQSNELRPLIVHDPLMIVHISRLHSLIRQLEGSADDTGCDGGLTVVDGRNIAELVDEVNGFEARLPG